MMSTLRRMCGGLKSRKGQSLVEYSLVLALIAVVVVLVVMGLGGNVNNSLSSTNTGFPG